MPFSLSRGGGVDGRIFSLSVLGNKFPSILQRGIHNIKGRSLFLGAPGQIRLLMASCCIGEFILIKNVKIQCNKLKYNIRKNMRHFFIKLYKKCKLFSVFRSK